MNIKIKRIIALIIDYILIFCVSYFPFSYINDLYKNTILNILMGITITILIVNLFLRKDCIIGYESIGKKLMNLKIYQNGIRVKDKKLLIDRVFHSLWLFSHYPFMILINNKSRGDLKMNTEVK